MADRDTRVKTRQYPPIAPLVDGISEAQADDLKPTTIFVVRAKVCLVSKLPVLICTVVEKSVQ